MGDEQLFEALGFRWDRAIVPTDVPVHSIERAVFRLHKALPEFVWDASMLEGNPFTFPEVQTLLDGVTVGGHEISDERQVLNLADSARELLRLVTERRFVLDKATSDHLHAIIAREEAAMPTASLASLDRSDAFDAGRFRGEGAEQQLTPGVALGEYGRYLPPETQPGGENLRRLHARGLAAITEELPTPYEQALVYFLFGALQQFYFDGNKRTARYMMNGHLMNHGIDAITVPARRAHEFNTLMVDLYRLRDATAMITFLTDCHPEATAPVV
jgi:Fic family protein